MLIIFLKAPSNYNFPPAIQHSQTMQNLPPSGPLPPQSNWSNTAPSRTRGRGRLRPEDLESSTNIFRCVTPDQYSAPSSRSHTPSQEYMQRYVYKCIPYFIKFLIFNLSLLYMILI